MKVILLKDVSKVGKKGEVKDVADGYARNMLLPMKLAMLAIDGTIKQFEEESKSKKAQKERAHGEFHALRSALMERGVVLKKKANENGDLYAAVSPKEILEALHELKFPTPANLDEKMILIDTPIKNLGTHEAKIKMGKDEVKLKIEVRELKQQE